MRVIRTILSISATALALVAAPGAQAEPPAPPAPIIPPPVQPANLGDLKVDVTNYYYSGAYLTDLQQAAWPAIGWIDEQAPQVQKPAVVFDIDETSLSNWDILAANDFSLNLNGHPSTPPPDSPPIAPTRDVFNTAKDHGVAIFFITGRSEPLRAFTEKNLADVGYTDYTRLIMKPTGTHYVSAADYKAPQRQAIEQEGYTIIANLGDQPSDLDGGFAERTYLLPNPFYRVP